MPKPVVYSSVIWPVVRRGFVQVIDKTPGGGLVTSVPFARLIAFLTLSALLLGLSSLGGPVVVTSSANRQMQMERAKLFQLVLVARDETAKPAYTPVFRLLPASIVHDASIEHISKPIWRIAAVTPVAHVQHFAPSLTGVVVLQV